MEDLICAGCFVYEVVKLVEPAMFLQISRNGTIVVQH